jgi:hypothetical protein
MKKAETIWAAHQKKQREENIRSASSVANAIRKAVGAN